MTDQHTPGPWGLETVPTSCGVCHKIGPWPHEWRAGKDMHACIYDDYPSPGSTKTMIANARLIAASPDLLAVAESVVAWASGMEIICARSGEVFIPPSFVALARAAIAKARGVTE